MVNALGITEKTIHVWETSDNPPKMTVIQVQKLLEIIGCTLDELASIIVSVTCGHFQGSSLEPRV